MYIKISKNTIFTFSFNPTYVYLRYLNSNINAYTSIVYDSSIDSSMRSIKVNTNTLDIANSSYSVSGNTFRTKFDTNVDNYKNTKTMFIIACK